MTDDKTLFEVAQEMQRAKRSYWDGESFRSPDPASKLQAPKPIDWKHEGDCM